jgi:hypothetical protein
LSNISEAKQVLDEQKSNGNVPSEIILKYEGDLQYYSQEQQIQRERLKSDPRIKKELEQWFNIFIFAASMLVVKPSLDFFGMLQVEKCQRALFFR